MKKIDLTPLTWLKKDEKEVDKKHCYFKNILGIVLGYISIPVIIYNFALGVVLLWIASYLIWTN